VATERMATAEKQSYLRRMHYASQMRKAQQMWREGNLSGLNEVLGEFEGEDAGDLRHFEWHHLTHLANLPHRVFHAHEGEAYAVVYSPDGACVITGGQDGALVIWDAGTGARLARIAAHESCINTIDFAPDGDTFVTASCDKTVKLWSLHDRRELATLHGNEAPVDQCRFLGDGKYLVAEMRDVPNTRIKVWDVATRELLSNCPLTTAGDPRFSSGQNRRELVTLRDDKVTRWTLDGDTWRTRGRIAGTSTEPDSTLSPDAEHLLVFNYAYSFSVVRLRDGARTNVQDDARSVSHLAFSAQGTQLATASRQGVVCILDFPSCKLQHRLLGHKGSVWQVAWSPTGQEVASVGSDGTLRLWDLRRIVRQVHLRREGPEKGSWSIAFIQDNTLVNATYERESILWDLQSGEQVAPDALGGPRLAARRSHKVRLSINDESHPLLPQWDPRANAPTVVTHWGLGMPDYTAYFGRLVAGGDKYVEMSKHDDIRDRHFRTWSVEPHELLTDEEVDLPRNVFDVAQDGRRLCGLQEDGTMVVCDYQSGRTVALGKLIETYGACMTPNGDRVFVLATPSCEFDAATGKLLREYAHESAFAAAYSAGAERIAIASRLGYIAIHDAATGEELLRLEGAVGGVGQRVLFSSDGTSLVTDGAPNGGLYLWPGTQIPNRD
jgi:WD40 repeat protein